MLTQLDRQCGSLLGLACGDAVGTTLEFCARGSYKPLRDMVGGGPFRLQAGQWTDDTSMALCLAESLIACDGFDAADQMDRYERWYREGYLSSTGQCFDIGNTVRAALKRYRKSGDPMAGSTLPNTSGNGSLMRLAPVVIWYSPVEHEVLEYSAQSSATTHGSAECLDACRYFGWLLHRVYLGDDPKTLIGQTPGWLQTDSIREISSGAFIQKDSKQIEGSGYVVRSLEAALWCFFNSISFEEAILLAANLGDDADTTAAICGQLAGAWYGVEGIPAHWQKQLYWHDGIVELARQLVHKSTGAT
ncbi:ADP-ribosylglycohydrolase family protein [Oceanobacter mangrovi]|uniref:ADP-ribosylglycohydrolase family protein n=1 Tax=Oceanobacter mangrovi TaxID=2862510 RepID=UPI001C8D4687|nr:ADP-ribosylglycohydrolase family protein [Oceanobacter mangrovi]